MNLVLIFTDINLTEVKAVLTCDFKPKVYCLSSMEGILSLSTLDILGPNDT